MLSLLPEPKVFKASYRWLKGFVSRYNLSNRIITGTNSKDLTEEAKKERMASFHSFLNANPADKIINMDQTPVWLSIGSTGKTVDIKGSKNVNGYIPKGVNPKEKISVILACDSKGGKLPPAIIVKSGIRAKPFEYMNGVLVFNNPKTSMANSDIMSKWIEMTIKNEEKTMLILDSFRGHLTEQIKQTCDNRNIVRAVIPGGMTKYLQPLDLTVKASLLANKLSAKRPVISLRQRSNPRGLGKVLRSTK